MPLKLRVLVRLPPGSIERKAGSLRRITSRDGESRMRLPVSPAIAGSLPAITAFGF